MSTHDGWFYETAVGGVRHGVEVSDTLLDTQTAYQHLQVFGTPGFGRMMVLDGYIQTTERDEHLYHQMLVQAPLAHLTRAPARVLVIGGGDGGSLREVLRHPVEQAVLAELDGGVVEAARTHLPSLHQGAFDDRRTEIRIGDGFELVRQSEAAFDAIIVDATDPDGPGAVLYSRKFYSACHKALRPGGVISLHLGVPFFQADSARHGWDSLSAVFEDPLALARAVPSYGGGQMLFALALKGGARAGQLTTNDWWSEADETFARLAGEEELKRIGRA